MKLKDSIEQSWPYCNVLILYLLNIYENIIWQVAFLFFHVPLLIWSLPFQNILHEVLATDLLYIPAFTRGKDQLNQLDVEKQGGLQM